MKVLSKIPTVTFAAKLQPKLQKGNCFYSPFSIQVALGMTAAGAAGETREGLCQMLECPSEDKAQKKFFKDLVKEGSTLEGDAAPYELKTANALWGVKGLKYKAEFQKNIAANFKGRFEEADYENNPAEAIDRINSWVSENTNDKIDKIVSKDTVDTKTRLVLTNAIYFKGKWEVQFNKDSTRNEDFKGTNGVKSVPTMHLTDKFRYCETDEFQAIDIPYKSGKGREMLSMLVVLPKGDLDLVEGDLEKTYTEAVNELGMEQKVRVSLPKFKLETEYTLKNALKEMGASLAFSNDADFSGITGDEPLKISSVVHKAFVECDEEGTEAAAATAVSIVKCTSFQPDRTVEFKADHSFIFFIRNQMSDNVLFSGRVASF